MAKKQNTTDLMAGLSFGDSRNVEKKEEPIQEKNTPEVKQTAPAAEAGAHKNKETVKESAPAEKKSLAQSYEKKKKEAAQPRTARIQAVVTLNTASRLDELVKNGTIDSKNDLINFLLESYLDSLE